MVNEIMVNAKAKYKTVCSIILILLVLYICMEKRPEGNYPILSVVIARIIFYFFFKHFSISNYFTNKQVLLSNLGECL